MFHTEFVGKFTICPHTNFLHNLVQLSPLHLKLSVFRSRVGKVACCICYLTSAIATTDVRIADMLVLLI
jgi:membrane associated rhomboid family serine protease